MDAVRRSSIAREDRANPVAAVVTRPGASTHRNSPVHVVVTLNEINDKHGTGPLVKRVFRDRPGLFSVRVRDDWGVHDFGDWNVRLRIDNHSRLDCFGQILRLFANDSVSTVTCIPFSSSELLISIALQEVFGAKLCVWIMDDQNVATNVIPDALMREFLDRCSLRLATHPELRTAYEKKYGLPVYILPAVVPEGVVSCGEPELAPSERRHGALLGSFWDQSWFDRLCSVLADCNCRIDWYGQNKSPWVIFPPAELARAGIVPLGIVPEDHLALNLRRYPFIIVPFGALDQEENNKGVAALSLPGRILFAAATSQTPILGVGSEHTCGAHFVKHFGIGTVVPYDVERVAAAMDSFRDPVLQLQMRKNAAAIATKLSDRGVVEWLAKSVELGSPADSRFEDLFANYGFLSLGAPASSIPPGNNDTPSLLAERSRSQ